MFITLDGAQQPYFLKPIVLLMPYFIITFVNSKSFVYCYTFFMQITTIL